jgi:hypothetical protein
MKPAANIESNGINYPFAFGMTALARFMEAENMKLNDIGQLGENMTIMQAMRLVYFGLKDGARRERISFDLTIDDVGDIMDNDPDFLNRCMEVVNASMPGSSSNEAGNVAAARKTKTSR